MSSLLPPPRRLCFRRCLSVFLSVCLLATLRKIFLTNLHEIFREGWQWANEQTIKFWWRFGSGIWIRIRIATLVRRALASWLREVCTVAVLLVSLFYPTDRPTWRVFVGASGVDAGSAVCACPLSRMSADVHYVCHVPSPAPCWRPFQSRGRSAGS